MSKAGAPIIKKKRPFVVGKITVWVLEDNHKRIIGFRATLDNTTHEIKVGTNILIAWQKLELIIDKHLGTQRRKGLASGSGRARKSSGSN